MATKVRKCGYHCTEAKSDPSKCECTCHGRNHGMHKMKESVTHTINTNLYKVGDIVKILHGEHKGELAFIYEEYHLSIGAKQPHDGVSLLLTNGESYDGFNVQEQRDYLEFVRDSGIRYDFQNVTQLRMDWDRGIFKDAFREILKWRSRGI